MQQALKKLVKGVLWNLHLDITRNMKYDRQTMDIMRSYIKPDHNCVDVGCHKGEMLEVMCSLAPRGLHFAFEPIPFMYEALQQKFRGRNCRIFPYALSSEKGKSTFNYVVNAPAYSGIKRRRYDRPDAVVQEINVELECLDNIIPHDMPVNLIKIDVEGAELGVLRGGIQTIKRNKPLIIFECGLGGSDFYGTRPADVYSLLCNECGMKISLMQDWLKKKPALSLSAFEDEFNTNRNWYFVAHT